MRGSKRIASVLALAAALVLAMATAAPAASVHFKGGKGAGPAFRDLGLRLRSTGALAGLGNADVVITLSATGNPTATCANPSGANQPPGQNPAPVTLTGTQSIPQSAIKNGTVSLSVTTTGPVSPVPGAPDCPNRHWTEEISDVAFTSADLTVEQPAGTVVLEASCVFTPQTVDGAVPSGWVSCSVT